MPVESRILVNIIAIVIPILGGIIVASWLISEKMGRLEEKINALNGAYLRVQTLDSELAELRAQVLSLEKLIVRNEAFIRLNDQECSQELKSMRTSIENARRYVRQQISVVKQQFNDHFMPHINNSDLHPRHLKIEQTR